MKVYLNEDGYVYLHAMDEENIPEGYIQVPDEDLDIEHFLSHRECYKWENGTLVYDQTHEEYVAQEVYKNNMREMRRLVCFPVINRGTPWYNRLTQEQREEIDTWYQSWLDAPETMVVPDNPTWLK